MPEAARRATLQMADHVIDRHLGATFAQLDAGTSDVEARKLLYVRLVERAFAIARERLPDSDLWTHLAASLSEDLTLQS